MAMLFVAIVSVGFASCGDDEDDDLSTTSAKSSSTWEKGTWKLSQLQVYLNGTWVLPHEDYDYEAKGDHDQQMPGFTFDGKGYAQMLEWEEYGEYPNYTYKLEPMPISYKYTKNGDELIIDFNEMYYMGQKIEPEGLPESENKLKFTYDRDYNVLALEESRTLERTRLTYKKQ